MAAYRHHITCRLTDKNLDQLRNLTLGNRVWATFISKGKGRERWMGRRDGGGCLTSAGGG